MQICKEKNVDTLHPNGVRTGAGVKYQNLFLLGIE